MKNYKEIVVNDLELTSITCDCCGVTHTDIFEIQEFLTWEDTCGYGNRMFGDLNKVELDLCQVCTFELLGKYVRVTEQNF
jgi:transposase